MNEKIGTQLKLKREELNQSLADVSTSTRIKKQYLQALEDGNFEALPSLVHVRGFLRTYAEYLGLPVSSMLTLLETTDEGEQSPATTPSKLAQSNSDNLEPEIDVTDKQTTSSNPFENQMEEVSLGDQPVGESTSSQEIFLRIGKKIMTQRLALGLKLEDVEAYTRLRLRHLAAIEAGNFNLLPSPVQAKGMISNYTRFLDLDTESLLLEYAEGIQADFIEKTIESQADKKPVKKLSGKANSIKFFITPDLMIGIGAILALVIFMAWSTSQIIAERQKELSQEIPDISGILLENTQPSLAENLTATAGPEMIAVISQTPIPESTTGLSVLNPTITLPALTNDPLQINVVAYQRAFLRVIVDGQIKFEGRVVPGNAYPFSGKTTIELLTGDASALEVLFNQTSLGVLGNTGEVANVLFTAEGLITPTPQFSPTPTSTSPPTLTPLPSPTQITPTITPFIP